MTKDVRDKLELLQDSTRAETLSEVIRRALSVYEFLWNEREKGNSLIVKGKGKERELVLI